MQQDLAKIGIKVVNPFTPNAAPGVFFGSYPDGGPLYTHKFDLAMYDQTLSSPGEPDGYFSNYHGTCGGTCIAGGGDSIPSPTNPVGLNDTGLNDPAVDRALDAGRSDVSPTQRAADYVAAEQELARDLAEIPLYQQITINTFSSKLRGVLANDFAWTYNSYDWYCAGGNCQG